MSDYIVDVENVTVRFNLANEKVDNLKEYFIKLIKHELMFQEFLALQNVSFKVKRGEAWALIGVNGSGKSTLLKTISGILKPYKGSVNVYGSIAPMIELGAGFDGNLTARENIFLNGVVLGHSKKFMQEHFNEIVDFAEVEDFLDTPIKNFSSGMVSRLGFAVAAVSEKPGILILDEILSVGDVFFKEKSTARIQELMKKGRAVLIVSHSTDTILRNCTRAVWIEKGVQKLTGSPREVCQAYLDYGKKRGEKA